MFTTLRQFKWFLVSVCRYLCSPVSLLMPQLPDLYIAICVDLVLQAVKNHSLSLLSSLSIAVATRTYFGESVRKELGVFVCSFSNPLMIINCFRLTHAAMFCMGCAILLFRVFFYFVFLAWKIDHSSELWQLFHVGRQCSTSSCEIWELKYRQQRLLKLRLCSETKMEFAILFMCVYMFVHATCMCM